MKTPDQLTAQLLEQTIELMFRVYLLRGTCSTSAREVLRQTQDHARAEDCARLDDALATVYRSLQSTVRRIQKARASNRRRA